MKGVVVGLGRNFDTAAPCRILSTRQVPTVDARFVCFLAELLGPFYTRVDIPAVSLALPNVGPVITIDICSGEPRRPSLPIHVHAVVVISKLEGILDSIALFASIGLHF